jgi:hypothetical protein
VDIEVSSGGGVNIREQPSISSRILAIATLGQRYVTTGQNDAWFGVHFVDGQIGYVSKKYVRVLNDSNKSPGLTQPTSTPLPQSIPITPIPVILPAPIIQQPGAPTPPPQLVIVPGGDGRGWVEVTTSTKIYAEASTKSKAIHTSKVGDKLKVESIGILGLENWISVFIPSGEIGWVQKKFVRDVILTPAP